MNSFFIPLFDFFNINNKFRRKHLSVSFGLLLLLLTTVFVTPVGFAEPTFPELTGRVIDQANMLSQPTVDRLSSLLEEHESQSSNQVVVVTLDDLQGYDISEFGYQLGRFWGIGQKGRNNGVLLIIAKQERKIRIEVGYGLEGALTDATSANIIQTIIRPTFKRGDFESGIEQGAIAIISAIKGEYVAKENKKSDHEFRNFLIFLVIFLLISFLSSYFGGGNGGSRNRRIFGAGGVMGGGLGGRFGGGGSGGFGGGGFSGGGGGFGGGGASGGW